LDSVIAAFFGTLLQPKSNGHVIVKDRSGLPNQYQSGCRNEEHKDDPKTDRTMLLWHLPIQRSVMSYAESRFISGFSDLARGKRLHDIRAQGIRLKTFHTHPVVHNIKAEVRYWTSRQ
jgi:hypothetical protein